MNQQTKNCVNCKKDFIIKPDDFSFYEKIKVPAPTWCPECRQQRRYAWRNERTLYRRNCDLCKKSTVAIYSGNKPFVVYCNECWWGDGWDASSYGRDFDFSTWGSEDVMYSTWVFYSRDCMDSSFVYDKGERLYEVIDSRTSYQCQYGIFLKDCSSCYYCYDCRGCNNCFLSSNLRNKSYIFKNKQYTREEYLKKLKEYDLSSQIVREGLQKEFQDMIEREAIHRYVVSERSVNSSGSLLFDCKNIKNSFEVNKGEDSKYLYSTIEPKNCMDLYHVGLNLELCYELQGCTRTSNCQFCHLCYDNMNVMYSDTCQNSQNLFGCVSVKKGEYMIFNKKYSKAEYENLKAKIIEHMKKIGEYGEFFPPSIAPVYYNETQGNLYMPMTKDEVLAKGWHWEDNVLGTFGKETISSASIPDKIQDVSDTCIQEILACANCSKNYNITQNELIFYRKEKIPLPRKCPNCRYKRRFDLRPARHLWHRKCMKDGCTNEFETSYAPDRTEKIFCEQCYNREVY